jgi:putative sterol carrier protein
MSTDAAAVSGYLKERVAPRFGEILQQAEKRLQALEREVDDLRAARGTVAWEVEGIAPCYLNVEAGAMSAGDAALEPPFMAVALSAADWERFASGAVGTGLLAPGSGRPMGKSRIDRMRPLKGAVRFVINGLPDGDWTATAYFGAEARPAEPQTTITVAAAAVEKIASGELNPQMAFMQGQVRFAGDAALAMQLGMAMMA